MSTMPTINVMPVQRGNTCARATATPNTTPDRIISAE